jgi:hypothetical protein
MDQCHHGRRGNEVRHLLQEGEVLKVRGTWRKELFVFANLQVDSVLLCIYKTSRSDSV